MHATLPLRDLEAIRRDPANYRAAMQAAKPRGFSPTISGALQDAAMSFDLAKGNDAEVEDYLQGRLKRFESIVKKAEALERLHWFIGVTRTRGWPLIQARLVVETSISTPTGNDVLLTGRVARLDLVPSGGYAGWIFTNHSSAGWDRELRPPLMQAAIAQVLSVPINFVRIGLCAFGDRTCPSECFSTTAIETANVEVSALIARLGY